MKKTVLIFTLSIILTTALMFSCGGGGGGGGVDNAMKELFTISYNANGAESGIVPAAQQGDEDSPQSVQSNTGNLAKSGYLFDGWNTAANGSGTDYAPGASYKGKDITLYAKWAAIFNVQVLAPASPAPALDGAQMSPGVSYLKILGLTARGRTLSNIVIPEAIDGYQVVSIGVGAFQGCSTVTDFSIPETVTAIEDNAFAGCTGITTLTIPRSVTEIGNGTFSGCGGLSSLVLLNPTPPTMGADALEGCTATVSVPAAGVDAYKTAEGWDTYSASIAGYSTEIYTVTFEDQGATTAPSFTSKDVVPPAVTIGQLPTPPQRTGYNFGGWFKEPLGAGGEFTASTIVSSNITVYAKWNEYSYTVTFIDQGATTPVGDPSKPVASPNTTVGTLPTEPANVGYYFGGWNTKSDGTGTIFTANTLVTGDITVYAIWLNNPPYTVTFEGQGATTDANPTSKQVVSPAVTVGQLPTDPVKTGYIFGGWFRNQEGTGEEFTASTVVTEDITVYAKWNSYSYTVTFDSQGADTPASPESKTVESPNTRVGQLPSDPVKEGYTFGGWFTRLNGEGTQIRTTTVVNSDLTVYAKWVARIKYTLTYDGNGNTSGSVPEAQQAYSGESLIISDNTGGLSATGSYFMNWNTKADGSGGSRSPGASLTMNADTTLYARWIPYSYFSFETMGDYVHITDLKNRTIMYLTLPSEVNGKTVNMVMNLALNEINNGLREVIIPDTITYLASSSFDNCFSLRYIEVSSGNENFSSSNGVLFNRAQTELIYYPQGKTGSSYSVPNGVNTIGNFAFPWNENLTNVTLPSSLTSIGAYAFMNSAIASITIPANVTSIGDLAFGSSAFTSINVNNSNMNYSSVNGVLYDKNKTELLFCPKGKTGSYTIPDSVINIRDMAFDSCSELTNLTIGNSITSIGFASFRLCTNLENITVKPTTPPTLGSEVFNSCSKLSTIKVPSESVAAYKAADGWKWYAHKIVADE